MNKAIAYYRVSTDQQGASGLGLEAQQQAVHDFARIRSLHVLHELTEIESGKRTRRLVLNEALAACKKERRFS